MSDLTRQIKELAMELGADLVGIASAKVLNSRAPQGHRPEDNLPGTQAVVCLGLRMLNSIFLSPNPRVARTSYTYLHKRLNDMGWAVATFLEEAGFAAVPITSDVPIDMMVKRGLWGDLSHRHAAVAAGLGKIGRSQLLLTPQFGARVRVTSVLTTAPLTPDTEVAAELCPERCRLCIDACPAGALTLEGLDKVACVKVMHRYNLYGLLRQMGRILDADSKEEKKKLAFDRTLAEVYMSLRAGDPPSCIECVRVCPVASR
ncbi:MAG: epoxyqueuosine reductase [Chloroflexi bacterium]|nr:epoxyqueuosine reductase [Chloroflexota bacterium]